MTTKSSAPAPKLKLLARIAVAQKQADSAKKTAKLAKLTLRTAKQKFKDSKHAAKKLRKMVKTLKAELVAQNVKRPAPKPPARKSSAKRVRPATVTLVPAPAAVVTPVSPDNAPPDVPPQ